MPAAMPTKACDERQRLTDEWLDVAISKGLNQREIGARLGVTQTQVSRILSRITGEPRASLDQPGTRAA